MRTAASHVGWMRSGRAMATAARRALRGAGLGLLLAVALPGAPSLADPVLDDVERATALAATDRDAAKSTLRALWDDPSQPLSTKAGVALGHLLVTDGEPAAALAMADALVARPGLAQSESFAAFQLRLVALTRLRDVPGGVSALRAQAQALIDAGLDRAQQVDVWRKLGALAMAMGQFKQAEDDFRRALDGLQQDPERGEHRGLYQNLGIALAQQANYPDALEAMLRAERINAALGEPDNLTLMIGLSALSTFMEEHQRAVDYGLRAAAVLPEGSPQTIKVYNNLGTANVGLGDLDAARDWYRKSLAFSDAAGQRNPTAVNNLGFVLLKLGQPQDALLQFETMLALASADNHNVNVAIAKKNLGETWIALGDRPKAAALLEDARVMYEEFDSRPKRLELYPLLIDNLEALGRSAEALKWMREYKSLSDEVVNVEAKERIAALESAIDLEKREAEIAVQHAQLAQQKAELDGLRERESAQRLQRYGLIALLIGLGVVVAMMVRDSRFKARAHRALTEKNREIEAQRAHLQSLNHEVRRQSEEDALTGLNNRHFLREFLARRDAEEENGSADRPRQMLAIIADLDHFKAINDRHGHHAGDQVLRHFAAVLRGCKRADDVLIRWGGEEFIWLCVNTAADAGPMLCERLRLALARQPVSVDEQDIAVSVSLGFAPIPVWAGGPRDAEFGLRLADHAVYLAKQAGRNRWAGYAGRHPPGVGIVDARSIDELEAAGNIVRVVDRTFEDAAV